MKTLRFGIEIEFAAGSSGLYGTGCRNAVAQRLAEKFGVSDTAGEYDRYGSWGACPTWRDAAGRKWKCVSDGSTGVSGELVSPILTLEDLPMVQEMVREMYSMGVRSSGALNCGIHIHLDKPENPAHLRSFVRLVNHYEDVVLNGLNITPRRTGWCRPLDSKFVETVEKLTAAPSDSELRAAWRNAVSGRYHGVNLAPMYGGGGMHAHGTAELRWFDGTLHAGKVKSYVMLALGLMAKSLTAKQVSGKRATAAATTTAKLEALRKMLANVGCGNKAVEFHMANGTLERAGEAKLRWESFESLKTTVSARTEREAAYYGRAV
jgi:hypothetical protein